VKMNKNKNKPTKRSGRQNRAQRRIPNDTFNATAIETFKYGQYGTLDAGAGTFAQTSIRATSLYDVDYTGTGTIPPRFAQLAVMYQTHVVLSAEVKVTFSYNDSVGPGGFCAVSLNEGSSAFSDIPSVLSDPRSKHCILTVNSAGGSQRVVTHRYDPQSFFGISKSAVDAYERINVSTTANPSDNTFFTLSVASLAIATNPSAMYYIIEARFVVKFKDPRGVAQALDTMRRFDSSSSSSVPLSIPISIPIESEDFEYEKVSQSSKSPLRVPDRNSLPTKGPQKLILMKF